MVCSGWILIVEDHPLVARAWERVAKQAGVPCRIARTLAQACEMVSGDQPAAVVLDLRLPDGDGQQLLEQLSSMTRVTVASGVLDSARALELQEQGILVLRKPISLETSRGAIAWLMRDGEGEIRARVDAFCQARGLGGDRFSDVIFCTLMGMRDKETADELGIARETIRTYWKRIFRKLALHSKPEVVREVFSFAFLGRANATVDHDEGRASVSTRPDERPKPPTRRSSGTMARPVEAQNYRKSGSGN